MKPWSSLVCAGILLLALTGAAFAGDDFVVDINELSNETQLATPDPDRLTSVWWLPREFWYWTFEEDGVVDEWGMEALDLLSSYTMVAVVDGEIGPFGGSRFVTPEDLRDRLVMIDDEGLRYLPLAEDEVSMDALNLVQMMRPMFTGMMGEMGANLGFYFFAAENPQGDRIASATEEGQFTIMVGDEAFTWRTPLGSALPPKTCPVDGERMSGAWNYCPWHGEELPK